MNRITRSTIVLSCVLAAATVLFAESAPAAASPDEKIAALERALAQTREELAALKVASAGVSPEQFVELERKIEILAAEVEALKISSRISSVTTSSSSWT